ncbi:histidine triad nucleotide-binding protein [Chloroflexota bacterium]
MDCIFCQIADGKAPGNIVYQDEQAIAFRDIHPITPTHLLIIPKKHIPSLAHLSETEAPLLGHMINIANQLAMTEGITETGYRLVINTGQQGGQLVPHLHMHLIGGRQLSGMLG